MYKPTQTGSSRSYSTSLTSCKPSQSSTLVPTSIVCALLNTLLVCIASYCRQLSKCAMPFMRLPAKTGPPPRYTRLVQRPIYVWDISKHRSRTDCWLSSHLQRLGQTASSGILVCIPIVIYTTCKINFYPYNRRPVRKHLLFLSLNFHQIRSGTFFADMVANASSQDVEIILYSGVRDAIAHHKGLESMFECIPHWLLHLITSRSVLIQVQSLKLIYIRAC